MIKLTIDNQSIEVPEGTTVLQAARQHNIHIPTLCDHPALKPYGSCRLCVVEVEGFRTLQPSCTLPANNNMVVHTSTDTVKQAREFVLSMLFSERNHFCPFCLVSGGDCELQNAAYGEEMTHWPIQPSWNKFPVDATHPYYVLDNNRCILCRRCVRACGELVGNFTLGIEERGADSLLVADVGVPLGESTCIQCGTCVQVCPTGALMDRKSAYQGLEKNVQRTRSVCAGCSVGCGINVVTRDNRLLRIEGAWEGAVNGGVICRVGRYAPQEDKRERVAMPLVKKSGQLMPATWDEALSMIADRMKPLVDQADHGVAALASTRLSTETLALFKSLFVDQFNSDMVTCLEEGLPTARQAVLADDLGHAFESKLDVLNTTDCIIALGANLIDNHQVAGFFVKRIRPQGVPIVVVDPGVNALDPIADCALKPKAGMDLQVMHQLAAAVIKQDLARNPVVFEANKTLNLLEGETGLPREVVFDAAKLIGKAKKPVIVYGKGLTAQNDPQVLEFLHFFAKLIGAELISLKGEANSLAASQLKLDRPFALNGHQAVYIALGDDYPAKRLIERLEKAPFLVVQASYRSALTDRADVVLPVTMWAEQDGHYVSLDGHLQAAHKSLSAPEAVRTNVEALELVAQKLNLDTAVDWKAELLKRTPIVSIR